jgi:bifunctional non-homologous end joining protein LigD
MLAVAGVLPVDDTQWGFEFKWDGVRIVAYVDGSGLRLLTRNDRDTTFGYPELHDLSDDLGSRAVVLDGEIVAFDNSGRPSFSRLQPRMHVADASRARLLASTTPVDLLVFDILRVEGHDTVDLSYEQRRALLDELDFGGTRWHCPPWYRGGGADVLRASQEQGLEGVMAKRLSSTYHPGRRSGDWRKVKNFRTQEVVIGGWTPGAGRRSGALGALLVGLPGPSGLTYAGKVGTGFSDAALDALSHTLAPLARTTSPFSPPPSRAESAGATWVTPALVGEVSFREWTPQGRLRQPSWRGLRPDKNPGDVEVEP